VALRQLRGCGHSWKRLRAFSLDNVTTLDETTR
jgi:hypothetical protein